MLSFWFFAKKCCDDKIFQKISFFEKKYLGVFLLGLYIMKPNKKTPKNAKELKCENCDFICFKKSEWDRHIITRKHKNLTNPNYLGSTPNNKEIKCSNCDKIYKHLSTLSAHKKKCIETNNILKTKKEDIDISIKNENTINELDIKTLIVELVKSNTELQKQ